MEQTLQDDGPLSIWDWANAVSNWSTGRYGTESTSSSQIKESLEERSWCFASVKHESGIMRIAEQARKKAMFRRMAVVDGNQTSDQPASIGHNRRKRSVEA